jgi:hypothetical protein
MLSAQGLPATVLDHDADMMEAARSVWLPVFYGDATRLDLLRTAGAQHRPHPGGGGGRRGAVLPSWTWPASTFRT